MMPGLRVGNSTAVCISMKYAYETRTVRENLNIQVCLLEIFTEKLQLYLFFIFLTNENTTYRLTSQIFEAFNERAASCHHQHKNANRIFSVHPKKKPVEVNYFCSR